MSSAFPRKAQCLMVFGLMLMFVCGAVPISRAQNGAQLKEWDSFAQTPTTPSRRKLDCKALVSLTGYEFSINSATAVPSTGNVPEHCRVSGQILPEIQFEVNLPTAWNGRFYMFGNGGYAGESFAAPVMARRRDNALKYGFAVAATNTGHDASLEPLATFALNRQKLLDYAYRAVHVTAMKAKEIMRSYYEGGLSHSYFDGCSTGGRQGLMSAQRFPEDFDGIVVGAPVLDFRGSGLRGLWNAQALQSAPLPIEKLSMLAERIYSKCDLADGLADGLIDDPRQCPFQPATDLPTCSSDVDGPTCFTTAQIGALEKIYGGIKSNGKPVFLGQPIGAEIMGRTQGPVSSSTGIGWDPWIVRQTAPPLLLVLGESFLKYMAFPKPDLQYDWRKFNFDTDLDKIGWSDSFLNATDPDLSPFNAGGGKIVMYFGWADSALTPFMGVDYYEQVTEKMGPSTTDFFRLFMVPGMFHCRGGVGVSDFDVLTPLAAWVERGIAPNSIIGARIVDGQVNRTRPLCPYPEVAKYKGSGSIDEAANFVCAKP